MTLRAISALICFSAWAAATFAQGEHLIRNGEVLSDNFPARITGYRIQLGSFSTESSAVQFKENLKSQMSEKIHLSYVNKRWRVRIGDFPDSTSCAEFLQSRLIPLGYADALVIADKIPAAATDLPAPATEAGFRLQVEALANCERAIELARNLGCIFPDLQSHVIRADSLYKVQMGDFRERAAAEAWKAEMEQVEGLQPIIVPAEVYGPIPPPPEEQSPGEDIFEFDD